MAMYHFPTPVNSFLSVSHLTITGDPVSSSLGSQEQQSKVGEGQKERVKAGSEEGCGGEGEQDGAG